MKIGNQHTVFLQVLMLTITFLILLLMVPFLVFDFYDTLPIFLLAIVFFGIFNLYYLRLNQIRILDEAVEIESLISKKKIPRFKLVGVKRTFFSPWIFKIVFTDQHYFFPIDMLTFYKGMFSFDKGYCLRALSQRLGVSMRDVPNS